MPQLSANWGTCVVSHLFREEDHDQDVAIHNEANQRDNGETYVKHIEGEFSGQQGQQQTHRNDWRVWAGGLSRARWALSSA